MKPQKINISCNLYNFKMLWVWLFLGVQTTIAQQASFVTSDSLKTLSYDSLYTSYQNVIRDTTQSQLYLSAYLNKAIMDKDTAKMAMAYSTLSYYISNENEKISLLDKAIAISENLNHDKYPIKAYSFKGGYYYKKGDYQQALDNYIKALAHSEKVDNKTYIQITKHNIGCIKTRIGKHKEALTLFKASFEYKKRKYASKKNYYLKSLIPLAVSYRYNQKLDSASIYNKEGILLSQENEKLRNKFYGELVLNEGINLFYKKEYNQSYDSITKSISLLKHNTASRENHILGSFYLGKLKLVQKDTLSAEKEFIAMDSIVQKEKIVMAETREGYEFLVSLYKAKRNKEQQLVYVNKLLRFDSIISKQRTSLSDRLFKEFDTPLVLKEKETLILKLKNNAKNMSFLVSFLISLSLIITVSMFYQYMNRKKYKEKFDRLQNGNKNGHIASKKALGDIGIADEVVEHILNKLSVFEQKQQFLKKNISITSLAKEINTNTRYLSKVINHHKHKSFTNYINELRVQYSVEQLKESATLKNYTIQGVAEEMGFNSAESFSSAFKKTTGIKPSYFMRKLYALNAE